MDRLAPIAATRARLRVAVRGLVQGVGFRPHVFRLARALELGGWVRNDADGVVIEAEGDGAALEAFVRRLRSEAPPLARVESIVSAEIPAEEETRFAIAASHGGGTPRVPVLPDITTCPDCLNEIDDPLARRHRYPFTNCTHCGPRFTIVRALPYDRPGTTMARFALCADCRREYEDMADRRFHAQPIACPKCGPALALVDPDGTLVAIGDDALGRAAAALAAGRIVAVKGIGGFHLMTDAGDEAAVARLRQRKPRGEKPFAVMVADTAWAARLCELPDGAVPALTSPEGPILLMPRRPGAPVAHGVAPDNPRLGIMLPPTALHHLLLRATGFPVVATSGNLSEEPICIDEDEALRRLGGIADLFLIHDRPIARHVDDSVAWIVRGETRLLRRARGYAPAPVAVRRPLPPVLAVGGHLKNTVALSVGSGVVMSQHIGDLETEQAAEAFARVIADLVRLWGVAPEVVAHDAHPDYDSTRWARMTGGPFASAPRLAVQHHHAHLAACLLENGVEGEALGVTWDGAGWGSDATIWGGEFLLGSAAGYRRVAHLRPFRLPGGDAAAREPRRSGLAALLETMGEAALGRDDLAPIAAFTPSERVLLAAMRDSGFNAPVTTSAGRLFDAVAAMAGLAQRTTYEGQAAMALEHAADGACRDAYPIDLVEGEGGAPLVLDWRPAIAAIARDLGRGVSAATIAARFHNALVDGIVNVARRVGALRVALTGGCFQNRRLVEGAATRLERAGFEVILHRQVPPNDGGIALGQVAVAAAAIAAGTIGAAGGGA